MTKAELLNTVHDDCRRKMRRHALLRRDVALVFDVALGRIGDDLTRRGRAISTRSFVLTGLGRLYVVKRPAREGRHPQTGAKIMIPEIFTVRFRPASYLLYQLNPPRAVARAANRLGRVDTTKTPSGKPLPSSAAHNLTSPAAAFAGTAGPKED